MADECRPPAKTPVGTRCHLRYSWEPNPRPGIWIWTGTAWHQEGKPRFATKQSAMAALGWRFHSIATPPDAPA